jgi:hypothetical protein
MVKNQRRATATAVIVVGTVPPLLFAAILIVTLGAGLSGHWEVFYAHAVPGTPARLMEAIEADDMADANASIANGADPNGLVAFRDPNLTGGYVQYLRPIIVAAAKGNDNMVAMLHGSGADLQPSLGPDGLCPATELGQQRVAETLNRLHLQFVLVECNPSRNDLHEVAIPNEPPPPQFAETKSPRLRVNP